MLIVGLTGGVGMGKSTVAAYWVAQGESLVDTDEIARAVVAPGTEGLQEIKSRFGAPVIAATGELDRAALASEVFADESRRQLLESIVHPRIREAWKRQVAEWRSEGKSRVVVVIPLLFETGASMEVDRTICVASSRDLQMGRLCSRGWTMEQARQRIAAQWPTDRKIDLADGVIWNNSTLEVCREQAHRLLASARFSDNPGMRQ